MSISDPDKQVLAALAADGDNHNIPRAVNHFFYGDLAPLEEVANRLEDAGWADLELARGEEDHRLIATVHSNLLDESIVSMMSIIEAATDGLIVEYDGWETSLERNN